MKIAPSILSANFLKLGDEINAIAAHPIDAIHLDVMDGHFVPNISFGPMIVKSVRSLTALPLDVHLMITNPEDYINVFKDAGATFLTIHSEIKSDVKSILTSIRAAGMKCGISINPATLVSAIESVLPVVDLVLVMSVNPGFGGQSFIPDVYGKIETLSTLRKKNNYVYDIRVDGGINQQTAEDVRKYGADSVVVGAALFKASNYGNVIRDIKRII